jgi:hypothetical protein
MHRIGATSQNGPRRNSGPVFVSSVLKCIHCIAEYGVSARTEMPIAFRTITRLNSAPLGIVRTTEADSVVIHTDTFGLLQCCALARPTRLELKVSSNTMAPLGRYELLPKSPDARYRSVSPWSWPKITVSYTCRNRIVVDEWIFIIISRIIRCHRNPGDPSQVALPLDNQ